MLYQIINKAIQDTSLSSEERKAFQSKLSALVKKECRLKKPYDDFIQAQNRNHRPSFFHFLRKKFSFFLRFTLHNYAWNQQKYDLALDELKRALLEEKNIDLYAILDELTSSSSATAIQQHIVKLLDALCYPEHYKSARHRYKSAITHLRHGLKNCPKDSSWTSFFSSICSARFCSVNLHFFSQSLVENMINAGACRDFKYAPCQTKWLETLSIDSQLQAMQRSPRNISTYLKIQFGKLKATVNIFFDPHSQTNIPHKLLDFKLRSQSNAIALIAMGTPTIERWRCKIIPEFAAFIQSLPDTACHLYINLQNKSRKYLVGDESARICTLQEFSINSQKKLHFITLAQDSSFYKQKGHFKKPQKINQFLAQFLLLMKTGQEGYSFPKLDKDSFWDPLESDLSLYAQIIFKKDTEELVTKDEKKDYIELAYPVIIRHLIQVFSPQSIQIVCKDGIDRAGKSIGLFISYLASSDPLFTHIEKKKLLAATSLARAPIVKAQPMISSRRKRFLSALARIENPKCQKALQEHYWKETEKPEIICLPSITSQHAIDA